MKRGKAGSLHYSKNIQLPSCHYYVSRLCHSIYNITLFIKQASGSSRKNSGNNLTVAVDHGDSKVIERP